MSSSLRHLRRPHSGQTASMKRPLQEGLSGRQAFGTASATTYQGEPRPNHGASSTPHVTTELSTHGIAQALRDGMDAVNALTGVDGAGSHDVRSRQQERQHPPPAQRRSPAVHVDSTRQVSSRPLFFSTASVESHDTVGQRSLRMGTRATTAAPVAAWGEAQAAEALASAQQATRSRASMAATVGAATRFAPPQVLRSSSSRGVNLDAASYGVIVGGSGGIDQQSPQRWRRVFSSVPADNDSYHQLRLSSFEEDEELLRSLAQQKATPLSLRDIHAFCQSSTSASFIMQACFLHREVPIRFAQRVLELRNLPDGLSETEPVLEAASWYASIVRQLVECPVPDRPETEEHFAAFLSSLLLNYTHVPQALWRGVFELEERGGIGQIQRHRIDRMLDNFFISRISLRFLVDTYISSKKNKPGFSGVIQSECSPVLVAWRAAADVDRLCRFHMGTAPPIEVFGREQDTFTAVPSYLYYILRELLKNSCRATVEHAAVTDPDGRRPLPPVKVIVARGQEDMTIKIVDEGGGMRRSELQHAWSYMYSTAPKPTVCQYSDVPLDHMSGIRIQEEAALLSSPGEADRLGTYFDSKFAFAGYGMGLPLSRLYARYFGGSLKLRPMEGYGTDAYLHLHRIKTNSEELLPTSLEETLRVMADDGRVNVTATRSWKTPPKDDSVARDLIKDLGRGL